jgi:hypothetical protein
VTSDVTQFSDPWSRGHLWEELEDSGDVPTLIASSSNLSEDLKQLGICIRRWHVSGLHVEENLDDVAVLDLVGLAFGAEFAAAARLGHGAEFEDVLH